MLQYEYARTSQVYPQAGRERGQRPHTCMRHIPQPFVVASSFRFLSLAVSCVLPGLTFFLSYNLFCFACGLYLVVPQEGYSILHLAAMRDQEAMGERLKTPRSTGHSSQSMQIRLDCEKNLDGGGRK